jgi:predicted metal-dependent hydrolase
VCWERLWAESPAPDAMDFLQGLIQLSAALVKRREGNPGGEAKLLAKAVEKLRNAREHSGGTFMGVGIESLIADVESGAAPTIILRV